MWRSLRDNWALFFGIAVLMLGNGLQGSLLAIRASLDGFPPTLTGIVLSAYYLGFMLGWVVVPAMIRKVGHVRVFAAFGSIASTTVLLHALYVEPVTWFLARMITGLALCAVFIATESWLNSKASNANRGQLLAIYMVILLAGYACGQFLLNLGSPAGSELFIVASLLVSLAVVPILLTPGEAPRVLPSGRLSPRALYRISPLATVAIFAFGIAQGGIYGGITAIYGQAIGLDIPSVSLFVALTIGGGMVLQWPLGWLSDRYDRRLVITAVTFAAATTTALAVLFGQPGLLIFILFFLTGGLSLPLYSLCVAHANDFMSREQMVGASSALLLLSGIGSALGPIVGATAIDLLGAAGFPLYLALVHAGVGAFALWRMTRRSPLPLDQQGPTIPLANAQPTPVTTATAQVDAIARSPAPAGH